MEQSQMTTKNELEASIQRMEVISQEIASTLPILKDKLNRLIQYELACNNGESNADRYLTQEELTQYHSIPTMIFEPNMTLDEWLEWFYEEIPFVNDKHLAFTDTQGNQYQWYSLKNHKVVANHKEQCLEVLTNIPIRINHTYDLYQMFKC